jgi:hypothetical protein
MGSISLSCNWFGVAHINNGFAYNGHHSFFELKIVISFRFNVYFDKRMPCWVIFSLRRSSVKHNCSFPSIYLEMKIPFAININEIAIQMLTIFIINWIIYGKISSIFKQFILMNKPFNIPDGHFHVYQSRSKKELADHLRTICKNSFLISMPLFAIDYYILNQTIYLDKNPTWMLILCNISSK